MQTLKPSHRAKVLLASFLLFPPIFADPVKTQTEHKRHTFDSPHLGTVVRLIFFSSDRSPDAKNRANRCFELVEKLNAIFSDYEANSELNLLCRKPVKSPHKVTKELFEVIAYAKEISTQSDGAFDITLGKDTKRWRAKRDGATEKEPSKNHPPSPATAISSSILKSKQSRFSNPCSSTLVALPKDISRIA